MKGALACDEQDGAGGWGVKIVHLSEEGAFVAMYVGDDVCPRCRRPFHELDVIEAWFYPPVGDYVAAHKGCAAETAPPEPTSKAAE